MVEQILRKLKSAGRCALLLSQDPAVSLKIIASFAIPYIYIIHIHLVV